MKIICHIAIASLLSVSLWTHSIADETGTTDPISPDTDITKIIGTSIQTEGKLTQEFSEFLGGEEQAATVIDGLRQGKAFSLNLEATDTPPTDVSTSSIEPPTQTMGYGNVKMTLKLAQETLSEIGITQPTNEQLSAVFLGGEINGQQVEGILSMRADGMGWGEISHQYDMKVGQLMGKAKSNTVVDAGNTQTGTSRSNGYISSNSEKPASGFTKQQSNGYVPSSKHSGGKGIVSASGTTVHQTSHVKSNGKIKASQSTNAQNTNKHNYISTANTASQASTISNAVATHSSAGKAKGHINKK